MLLLIADRKSSFPLVMVGGVIENNKKWDIGKEVINCITEEYPGACPIRPKVNILKLFLVFMVETMLIEKMLVWCGYCSFARFMLFCILFFDWKGWPQLNDVIMLQ